MGKAIIQLAQDNRMITIIGGVGPKGRKYIGRDLGSIAGVGDTIGAIAYDDINEIIHCCDVVVECTNADASLKILRQCVSTGKPFVSGTTGISEEHLAQFRKAGERIPVLLASNTSKIAHLFFHLIKWVSGRIGKEADIDIIEMHDRNKLDAPSGTAKEIGNLIAIELGLKLDEIVRYQRLGKEIRPSPTIDYTSIRTGNYATTHRVIFGFDNEKLELSFDGYNMYPFAGGILDAVVYLHDKSPDFYTIEQVFKLKD